MKDKSISDAIASLRADLDRLEARVKEEVFVPGWYLCWNEGDEGRNLMYYKGLPPSGYFHWNNVKPFTQELASQFLPTKKTRYNWPEIIKQYPEAQWASTDRDGRVDLWKNKPLLVKGTWTGGDTILRHRYSFEINPPDWADSLEKRPDYL